MWFVGEFTEGYHQVTLDEEDRDILAIIKACSKFRYKCLPMGASVSGCKFNSRTDTAILGLENFIKSVDDLLWQWVKVGVMRLDVAVLMIRLLDLFYYFSHYLSQYQCSESEIWYEAFLNTISGFI